MESNLKEVRISLDDCDMTTEFECPNEWDEDRFYQEVVDYILSNIDIEVL